MGAEALVARNVILKVRDGDPACDRAREFVTRMAAELGLELDVRSLGPSSDEPLPQILLWDETRFDRVADEATLRDSITAKIWSEDAAAGAEGIEQSAEFAREEAERSAERKRFAKTRVRRKPRVVREPPDAAPAAPPEDAAPSREGVPERSEREGGARVSAPHPRPPVLLRGGRRGRWDLAGRIARKIRSGGVPVAFVTLFFVAAVVLGGRESSGGDPAPRGEVPSVEAPGLDLPTLDGFRFDLARERGRALLLVLFDARKPDRNGLVALAAEAEKVMGLSRGDARVVAIGVGLGVAELRAALRDMPFALTVAADADGRTTGTFAAAAGQGGWWLVDRTGRVVGRGGQPGPDAFAALLAHAGGARARP